MYTFALGTVAQLSDKSDCNQPTVRKMSPEFKFRDGLHSSFLLQNLFELQSTESLCDMTLVINNQEIKAHKVILASASPYFRIMFNSGLKEARQNRIEMHEVEYSIMKDIVNFFYTAEIMVTEENAYCLMEVADLLQVAALKSACSHYLSSTLNPSNCLSVYVHANLRNYHDLAHKAFRYALQHFEAVMLEEEFLHAPIAALHKVLDSRFLQITDEGQVLQGILRWWREDPEGRLQHLENLACKLNLEDVPMEQLLSLKRDEAVADTKLLDLINHTINFVLEQRYDTGDIKTLWALRLRKAQYKARHSHEQEVILAIGGEWSGVPLGSVECFTLGYDGWKCMVPISVNEGEPLEETRVIPTMRHARYRAAVTSKDYELFVVGGYNCSTILTTVEYYSIQSNEWSDLAPLPLAVEGTAAVILEQQLHVLGGQGNNGFEKRVWIYEENLNMWHEGCALLTSRGHHCAVTAGGSIYVLGGRGGEENSKGAVLKSVEKYDAERNQWYFVASMHDARAHFGCAVLDEFIYVMGGHDGTNCIKSVERYNILTNEWCFLTSMSVPRSHFGTTVASSRIYCMGGYDGIHFLNTVEKFNAGTNKWHCVHAMQVKRYGMGAATLRVPLYTGRSCYC